MGNNPVRRMARVFTMTPCIAMSFSMIPLSMIPVQLCAQSVAVAEQPERDVKEALVSISVDGVPLQQVLKSIAQQAGLMPFYSTFVTNNSMKVTMHVKSLPASVAFERALDGTGLRASIVDRKVLFGPSEATMTPLVQGSINGRVVDAKTKAPIRGATVTLDDATKGVISNDEGSFHVTNVAPGTHTVRVRMLGYVKAVTPATVVDGQTTTVEVALALSVNALDQVVVTGTVIRTELKAVPNAITVITAKDIEERGITQIQQLFRGDVPGLFAVNFGANNPLDTVTMFSRGATDFAGSAPSTDPIKTYVDGVELANPAFLSQIDPRSIERIEILAGPQASTIYGSNAINGVMQIFTKRGSGAQRPQFTATLLSGLVQNNFSSTLAPQHDYSAQVNGVEGRWSYNAGGSWQHMSPWNPAKQTTTVAGFGGGRMQIGAFTADASLRMSGTQNDQRGTQDQTISYAASGYWSASQYYMNSLGLPVRADLNGQTLGLTLSYAPTTWWSQEVVAGTDRSQTESGWRASANRFAGDTALQFFQKGYQRTSLRYATTARVPVTTQGQLAVTVGADGWQSLQSTLSVYPLALTGTLTSVGSRTTNITRVPGHNAGAFLQAQFGVRDALFFTYGLRAEWNPNYGADALPNYAPRFGVAYTRDFETPWGALTAKARASYGRSTRPPQPGEKAGQTIADYLNSLGASTTASYVNVFGNYDNTVANPDLGPEVQQGGEGGLELYFGTRGSLIVTRYNQTVDQMINGVEVDSVPSLLPCNACGFGVASDGYAYRPQYMDLNVGTMRNQGWEGQGSLTFGALTARATYSWVKNQMIGVNEKYRWYLTSYTYQKGYTASWLPDHTWALGMTYAHAGTSVALNIDGIGHYLRSSGQDDLYNQLINPLIRLTANRARMTDTRTRDPGGRYAMADLSASHRFTSHVEGLLQIQNLTDYYQMDYTSTGAVLGRQSKAGLRIRL